MPVFLPRNGRQQCIRLLEDGKGQARDAAQAADLGQASQAPGQRRRCPAFHDPGHGAFRPGDRRRDHGARFVHQRPVAHAVGADALAGAATQAQVDMLPEPGIGCQPALCHGIDQLNAAAGGIGLRLRLAVSGAIRQAESAGDTAIGFGSVLERGDGVHDEKRRAAQWPPLPGSFAEGHFFCRMCRPLSRFSAWVNW
ncbi:hypothetical protein GALL_343370 [mine drainage metagenome]|uniref:Uncharacterized protein n=1 Tax=mine drainage metagenome TaxID=410659 RepID=A0A1J5QVI9_9ZZZZ